MIDSHIQMPKLLLKRFHNKYNFLCYYDIAEKIVKTRGTAHSLNTSFGYYSDETERFLSEKIETPIGRIFKYLDDVGIETKSIISAHSDIRDTIIDFIYALIARAPNFHKQMCTEDSVLNLLTPQERRDTIIKAGIAIEKEACIFSEYIITFLFNKTNIPFVLSMNGIYQYTLNGFPVINLPISPYVAIFLVHKNYSKRFIHSDGAISMIEFNNPEDIMLMNDQAFQSQQKHGWGYVVCPERDELDRLVNIELQDS